MAISVAVAASACTSFWRVGLLFLMHSNLYDSNTVNTEDKIYNWC